MVHGEEIPSDPFEFRFVPAPESLAPYLNALALFRSDRAEMSDIMPSFSPQLMLFGEGSVTVHFENGDEQAPGPAFFVTQLDAAVPFTVHGPARSINASLNVLGWAALTRLPVDETSNRVIAVEDVVGAQTAKRLEHVRNELGRGAIDLHEGCSELAAILEDSLMPLPDAERFFMVQMRTWLSETFTPDLAVLRERVDLSDRQIQRLSKKFFGGSPSAIVKRYRAVRAATVLSMPDLPEAVEAEILAAYYDQAHLIRDLRRYTGRTPRRLQKDAPTFGAKTLSLQGYGDASFFDRIIELEAPGHTDES